MDRDTKFSEAFRHFLIREDITPIQLPPRSPNLNAHLERFMRSIKSECLSRMIFFGEKALRNAVTQYLKHYHHERNHQGDRVNYGGQYDIADSTPRKTWRPSQLLPSSSGVAELTINV